MQFSQMKATLFALRCNELLDAAFMEYVFRPNLPNHTLHID